MTYRAVSYTHLGVGGVAGDGALNVLLLHDGNALHDVVGAVALDSCALALGEGDLLDDGQGLRGDVALFKQKKIFTAMESLEKMSRFLIPTTASYIL